MARQATPSARSSAAAKAEAKDERAACAPVSTRSSFWARFGKALAVARLAFNCGYLHPGFREAVRGSPVEHAFVFWAHLGWTPLWPVGAIDIDKADGVIQALACRFAKYLHVQPQQHAESYINYLIFLDRVAPEEDVRWMYAVQALGAAMLAIPAAFPSVRRRGRVGAGALAAYVLVGLGYAVVHIILMQSAIYRNNVDCGVFARSTSVMGILPSVFRLPTLALTAWAIPSGHLPRGPGTYDWAMLGNSEWSYDYWDPATARVIK